ncbi:hypothetical protein BGX34_006390 [Mortierella sp. NVP85]|nr:hypothetical protein BGX34_006390 [Mortierella sp. NVP85]
MSFRHRPDPEGSSRETATLILLTNRRHQSQNHQQRLLSSLHTRTRDTSDVDVSSDFSSLSEVDLYRGDPLSGDFSDYEMPLGGRWDLAAHWHLGDYSEGVEGDADDDDDEERDNDTDLSESTGRSRSIHLDLGRVQEILESSPSSTPIVVTRLPSFWNGIDISSSASEDIDSGHPATASSERIVRFNSREPQRAHTSSLSTLDNAHHSSGRETTLTLNLYTRGHDDIHPDTYHADMDDSQALATIVCYDLPWYRKQYILAQQWLTMLEAAWTFTAPVRLIRALVRRETIESILFSNQHRRVLIVKTVEVIITTITITTIIIMP